MRNPIRVLIGTTALVAVVAVVGCKKEEVPPTPPPPPTPTAEATPARPAASPSQPRYASGPAQQVQDPAVTIAAAEEAIKQQQYQDAARAMVMLQRQKALTDAQAAQARNNMIQLQGALAGAVANGDANAKAAAEILRRSASGN